MLEAELLAGISEVMGSVARSVVGHDPFDGDVEAFVPGEGGFQEGDGACFFLVGPDVSEAEAGVVVDADMYELPADSPAAALALSIFGDAVAYPVETAQFFDIDVDHLAGASALIAARRLRWLQVAPAVAAVAGQDPSDGRP